MASGAKGVIRLAAAEVFGEIAIETLPISSWEKMAPPAIVAETIYRSNSPEVIHRARWITATLEQCQATRQQNLEGIRRVLAVLRD